jgi:hypothetical protein
MPLKLIAPVKKEFVLEKTDKLYDVKGEPTKVTIRQATQGEHAARNDLFSMITRHYDGDEVSVSQRISFDDLHKREVFLTLCACNIVDEDGKPLFTFEDDRCTSEKDFENGWYLLSPAVANEIHAKVLEVNIDWKKNLGE